MLDRFFLTNPAANFDKQIGLMNDFFCDIKVMEFASFGTI